MSEKSFKSDTSSVSSRRSRRIDKKKLLKKKFLEQSPSESTSSLQVSAKSSASDFFSPIQSPIKLTMDSETRMMNLEAGLEDLKKASTADIHTSIVEFLATHKETLNDRVNHTIAFAGFNAEIMRASALKKTSLDNITLLCLVGLVRGNNIERIKTTMKSKELTKKFAAACTALKVKKAVSGDYDAITLSRMIACFPDIVLNFLHSSKLTMAVEYSELTMIHAEFPSVARHQVCASILHANSTDEIKMCLDVVMVPYIKTSEVINAKNKKWNRKSKGEKITESSRYLLNSFHSKLFSPQDRERFCKHFSIITIHGGITTVWKAAAINCKQYLKRVYDFSFTDEAD